MYAFVAFLLVHRGIFLFGPMDNVAPVLCTLTVQVRKVALARHIADDLMAQRCAAVASAGLHDWTVWQPKVPDMVQRTR